MMRTTTKMLTGGRWKSSVRSGVVVDGVSRKPQKLGQNGHEEEAIIGAKGIEERSVGKMANHQRAVVVELWAVGKSGEGKIYFSTELVPFYRRGYTDINEGPLPKPTDRPTATRLVETVATL
jgi:hypothetical protein